MRNDSLQKPLLGGDEIPSGTFHGGDEIPAGTFHGGYKETPPKGSGGVLRPKQ